MRCFGGFRSSRRYNPNQKNEILNFRVVPDLQISKKVELLMIYMFFTFSLKRTFKEKLKRKFKKSFQKDFFKCNLIRQFKKNFKKEV